MMDILRKTIFVSLTAVGIVWALSGVSFAEEQAPLDGLFVVGNRYYEEGKYDEAIKNYETILRKGYCSGNLYFNLGNAYFRSGDKGKAIINYMRAGRHMPRDADITANLRFARAGLQAPPVKPGGIKAWYPFKVYSGYFTLNEIAVMASLAYVLSLFMLAIAILRPGISRQMTFLVLLLFLFVGWNGFVGWEKARAIRTEGLVVVNKAEALFGPYDSATKFFTLHEGMPVNIIKTRGDWYKVKRADGRVGWVEKTAVAKI